MQNIFLEEIITIINQLKKKSKNVSWKDFFIISFVFYCFGSFLLLFYPYLNIWLAFGILGSIALLIFLILEKGGS